MLHNDYPIDDSRIEPELDWWPRRFRVHEQRTEAENESAVVLLVDHGKGVFWVRPQATRDA